MLDEILAQLRQTAPELHPSAQSITHLFSLLLTDPSTPLALLRSESLRQLAHEKLNSYPYKSVPLSWRQLYTDSTITLVLGRLMNGIGAEEEVRLLDMCIIVAGVPQRREIVFRLLKLVQDRLPTLPPPSKRPRLTPPSPLVPPTILHPIPRLATPPPFETSASLLQTPFIITAGCLDWPASQRWKSSDYLRQVAGRGRVVPVEIGKNYSDENWSQSIIPFEDFLHHIDSPPSSSHDKLYLAQHDLFRQFPELENDVRIPDYVYSAPESSEVDYLPPGNEEGWIMNAWFGPGGSVSPAHTDPYYNCFAQVIGRKYLWLAPPSVSSSMYPFTPSSPSSTPSTSYMSNTTRLDLTRPLSPADVLLYPNFVRDVEPVSMQAVLEPGDLLFMPPGWWHSLMSLERSFSVSIWF